MSAQKRSDLQALYGSSGSQLPDNTSGDITPSDLRSLGQDITDSEFNLIDDKYTGAAGVYLSGVTDTTSLKAIVTVGVTLNIIVFYVDSTLGIRSYQLVNGTDSESLPYVVRPTDYDVTANHRVWKLLQINGNYQIEINIGDWNMDSTDTKSIAHGLSNYKKVRSISVIIRDDADSYYQSLIEVYYSTGANFGGSIYFDATNITLTRVIGGTFDSTSYDATSYNRGWITIEFAK